MTSSSERRRYFRINDRVGVAYQKLDLSMPEVQAEDLLEVSPLSQLDGLDVRIEAMLSELRVSQPKLGALLDALNQKLNSIVTHLTLEDDLVQRLAHKVQEVNISACGMAFSAEEQYLIGDLLAVEILLLPSNLKVSTQARVVGAEANLEATGYYTRVEFMTLEVHDQEVLIQHIVKRQATLLRNAIR